MHLLNAGYMPPRTVLGVPFVLAGLVFSASFNNDKTLQMLLGLLVLGCFFKFAVVNSRYALANELSWKADQDLSLLVLQRVHSVLQKLPDRSPPYPVILVGLLRHRESPLYIRRDLIGSSFYETNGGSTSRMLGLLAQHAPFRVPAGLPRRNARRCRTGGIHARMASRWFRRCRQWRDRREDRGIHAASDHDSLRIRPRPAISASGTRRRSSTGTGTGISFPWRTIRASGGIRPPARKRGGESISRIRATRSSRRGSPTTLDGRSWWLVMSAQRRAQNVYAGTLLRRTDRRSTRPCSTRADVTSTPVGSGTLRFSDTGQRHVRLHGQRHSSDEDHHQGGIRAGAEVHLGRAAELGAGDELPGPVVGGAAGFRVGLGDQSQSPGRHDPRRRGSPMPRTARRCGWRDGTEDGARGVRRGSVPDGRGRGSTRSIRWRCDGRRWVRRRSRSPTATTRRSRTRSPGWGRAR